MVEISKKMKEEMQERFTKYEIARILGARALQIAMNAPILINLDKEDIERVNFDPLKLAEFEFYADVLPITVKRPLPPRREEKEKPREEPKAVVKEPEEKKETKEEEVKKEKTEEKKKSIEKKPEQIEKDIIKEVEGSEIMEMARPEDEAEEEPSASVEE